MNQPHVLVTGGSGFIAGHCILQLLAEGHAVRATLRSLSGEASARAALEDGGMTHGDRQSFVAADLLHDAGWADALRDMAAVLHVASPVRPGHVEDEDDLIVPARDGTLRVLRAARDAGVRRVVLTSAFHAVIPTCGERDSPQVGIMPTGFPAACTCRIPVAWPAGI